MRKIIKSKSFKELFKYGIVGCLNATIGFVVYKSLSLLGAATEFANFTAYFAGFLNSFYLNRKWTFKSNGSVKTQGIKFFLGFGICFLLQFAVFELLKNRLFMNSDLAYLVGMVVFTLSNFSFNKFFTFKKDKVLI